LTTRVYPVLSDSTGISYDLGDFDERKVELEFWADLKSAWPERDSGIHILEELHPLRPVAKTGETITTNELHKTAEVPA
jgi:hypothetical protein